MKKRYQFISYVLIMTMVLSFVPITKEDFVAFAEEIITTDDEELLDSGSCGENLTYKLTTDGTLTISGTGEMTIAPWSKYCNKIKKINMEEGITKIHVNAFADCQLVESIKIPDTVTEIENGVFFRCYKLKEVEMSKNIMSIGEDSFYRTAFYDDLNNWEGCALYCGDALIAIIDPSDLYEYTWCDIREGTRIVADSATYASRPGGVGERSYCTALYGLKCPDSLIRIGNEAFYNCTNLTYVYFQKI